MLCHKNKAFSSPVFNPGKPEIVVTTRLSRPVLDRITPQNPQMPARMCAMTTAQNETVLSRHLQENNHKSGYVEIMISSGQVEGNKLLRQVKDP